MGIAHLTMTQTDPPSSTAVLDEEAAPPPKASRLSHDQRSAVVGVIVAVSAVGGVLAAGHPTDLEVADALVVGGWAALVPWCTAHARRWAWCWLAGVAGVATVALLIPFVLSLSGLVVALASIRSPRRQRIAGAASGALAVQALLRIGDLGPLGVPALVTLLAVLPVLISGHRHMRRRHRRQLNRVAWAVLAVAVVGTVSAGAVALIVRGQLVSAVDRSEAAVAGVGEGEQESTVGDLDAASADFDSAGAILSSPLMWPARSLPVVGPHVGALRDMAGAGEELTDTASANLGQVDYDRLRYQSGRVNLEAVEAVAPALGAVRAALVDAEDQTGALDSPWLVSPLTNRVDELHERLTDTRRQADTASIAVDLAPEMLGADGPRRYLVVFPTPSELRGGGGFVGNYVILDAEDGEVRMTESSRIRSMIDARARGARTIEGLPGYVEQYGRFRPQDFNQDILFSPHFPWDADAFAQVAQQSGRGEIDAVISMAPSGLAALLTLTGPVPIPGRAEPVTPGQAEDFLQVGQYLEYRNSEERADALEALTEEVFDRLTNGSLPSPRTLGELLGPLVPTRDVLVWSARPEEQELLARLDLTGELPEAGAMDLVHVSGINGGPNKIDVFLNREVEVEPRLDPETGEVLSTVTVRLRNDAPPSGLPPYLIGNDKGDPPGTNRHRLTVFTPLSLEEATVDGFPVGVTVGSERGYATYSRYVEIPPGATVTVELELRGVIPDMEGYRLVVPAQPMVNPDELVVTGPLVGSEERLTLDRQQVVVGRSD